MNRWLKKIIRKVFYKREKHSTDKDEYFNKSIILKDRIPDGNSLKDRDFIEVVHSKQSCWAVFKCPCGCNTIISLPLQKTHRPHWKLEHSNNGKPTLYPSVWQNKGCLSHFWIVDGKIEWCKNTGIEPWIAEPKYYQKPIK